MSRNNFNVEEYNSFEDFECDGPEVPDELLQEDNIIHPNRQYCWTDLRFNKNGNKTKNPLIY